MKWNTVISVIGLLSAATSAIPLADIERNYDGHLANKPILPRHVKRVVPGKRPDDAPNPNPVPRPIPRQQVPEFSPNGKTPSQVKAQKPNYNIRGSDEDGSTDQTTISVKEDSEKVELAAVLNPHDMPMKSRVTDDWFHEIPYSNVALKRGGITRGRGQRSKNSPAQVVEPAPQMKAAIGPEDFAAIDPYTPQPGTDPKAPTVAMESLTEFAKYAKAGIFEKRETPLTLTETADLNKQLEKAGVVLSRAPRRVVGSAGSNGPVKVNNPIPDLPEGQSAFISVGYSPRIPTTGGNGDVSPILEHGDDALFANDDGIVSPVDSLSAGSQHELNLMKVAPYSNLARQSQAYQNQPQKRQEVQNTITKRDIITQISNGEENANSSARADQMAQIQEYIWAFDMTRQNVTSIVEPFIIDVLNGTNSYLGEAIAWSLYSLTVPDTPVSGPFKYGLSKLTSAANATGTTTDAEMQWLEEVEQYYFSIWNETVTAVNQTGLLDDLATLASYLLPEDPTLLPDSFRNADPHGEEPFLPFLESMYQYNGYYFTADQVTNGTSPYILHAWDFVDASNPYGIQWWSNSTSNSTTNSTSSLNSTYPANATYAANVRRALKPVPINYSI